MVRVPLIIKNNNPICYTHITINHMNKQIIDNINNNDLMFGYTNYKLIQLLVMLLSKLCKINKL